MIDDEIGHNRKILAERCNVIPVTQPGINPGVIYRVEAGVGAIDWVKERQ